MSKKVIVVDYDPHWATEFQQLKNLFSNFLGDTILAVEHVGSTSVVGLKAKPKLDIDIIVEDKDEKVNAAVNQLAALGYLHRGDLGVPGREAFRRSTMTTPFSDSKKEWMNHNLYVCRAGCTSLKNHLTFRDFLRKHPTTATAYGDLKTALAQKFPNDMDAYIDGKTDFITGILAKAGFSEEEVDGIKKINEL